MRRLIIYKHQGRPSSCLESVSNHGKRGHPQQLQRLTGLAGPCYAMPRQLPFAVDDGVGYIKPWIPLLIINVKKLQFIHKLTASDTSQTAKITKRWYYPPAHCIYICSFITFLSYYSKTAFLDCLHKSFSV